ncbi:unnamed protein product [Polarella glacialis]|uniref:Uncharacterized protein n=1 Tax=Polarella glacialis TaxID=89957 RepID=A0A813HTH1_POLGL|nr:unnamed protein product [Polarella glacialis]
MLELTGCIAMESDDVETIEAWITQAVSAKLAADLVQPKEDRVQLLRSRRDEEQRHKELRARLEKAMRASDLGALRDAVAVAHKARLPEPGELQAAKGHLKSLEQELAGRRRQQDLLEDEAQQAREQKALAELASVKLRRARLLPSAELEISQQERAALEQQRSAPEKEKQKEKQARTSQAMMLTVKLVWPSGTSELLEVTPSQHGAVLLSQLLPLKSRHCFPRDFAIFLPSGEALDFLRPLTAQGIFSGCTLRVDDAQLGAALTLAQETSSASSPQASQEFLLSREGRQDAIHETSIAREKDDWDSIYWPLCVAFAPFRAVQQALQRHPEVVVLGWEASQDAEVMQLCHEVCWNVQGDFLLASGQVPVEDSWLLFEHRGAEPTLRSEVLGKTKRTKGTKQAPQGPKSSFLRVPALAEGRAEDLGRAICEGVQALGCGTSYSLILVGRPYYSRRAASIIRWYLQAQGVGLGLDVTVLPYSWDPRLVIQEDCHLRGLEVLTEAQLLVELNPAVFSSEEAPDAEVALSRLLRAHPTPKRPHWHEGFYSKAFQGASQQQVQASGSSLPQDPVHWQRWQRAAPLSSGSLPRAKAAPVLKEAAAPVRLQRVEAESPIATAAAAAAAAAAADGDDDDDDDDDEPPPLVEWHKEQDRPTIHNQLSELSSDSVEFWDIAGERAKFLSGLQGGLDFAVQGQLVATDLVQLRVDGGRRICFKGTGTGVAGGIGSGTFASGKCGSTGSWCVTVPLGHELVAQRAQQLFQQRPSARKS